MHCHAWMDGHHMILNTVNQTILSLCAEVESHNNPATDWQSLTEEDLLFEATTCIFGSQMLYEVAVAAATRIRSIGLLRRRMTCSPPPDYEARVLSALSTPLPVEISGVHRSVLPRFKNRLASLLASTIHAIHGRGSSLRDILLSAQSARHARQSIVDAVWGFGPKQASLFLRRIGYCSELAVLDTHILEYLRIAQGIEPSPQILSRLSSYERIEAEFQRVASEFGHAVGCVDLAMWVTMRVAKREAVL